MPPCPRVEVKMLHDSAGIYGLFRVHDNFVRVVQTQDQAPVYTDSCVEFFVQPNTGKEYFNFEMNGDGALLLYRVHDPATEDHLEIPQEDLNTIRRFHTLPQVVEPEIQQLTVWQLGFFIPISFFVKYASVNPELSGQKWRGNFTKCADSTCILTGSHGSPYRY